ncbi:Pimeloyl-ACP methyl ester carboxylesterase [Sporobacter termitidis DSM 10068]|uniref:Pimeloyl-ACP methyl ester carboxylesterase n=1 Tax=Sporobacter termitidis DSM 10068 TaxID=1123282 RepID=A0A1M5TN35_9FIRM|nr:alpha/beta hydrolase [Sporobacter termitidis]SHH52071.1 Pimeloyl-ACP methyl ester carboxylesterase [Sporobacter termitidis DSM 10068]
MNIRVNGIDLWYEKTGDGPPIVLLHGNGESHRIFSVLTGQLSENFTVYALDSRDHGQSGKSRELTYGLMTEDTARFIEALGLDRPAVCGFSDGGIIGLMLASWYPGLLSRLVVCGASTSPEGTKRGWLRLFRLLYLITRDKKYRLMLTEPHITKEDLKSIDIPVLVLAGEKDMIRAEDTRFIAGSIPGAALRILRKENHMSYVINSPKLYGAMETFLRSSDG